MLPQKLYTDQTSDSSQEVYEVIPLKRFSQKNTTKLEYLLKPRTANSGRNYTYHSWLGRVLHQNCFSSEVIQAEANNGNVYDSYEDSYPGNIFFT